MLEFAVDDQVEVPLSESSLLIFQRFLVIPIRHREVLLARRQVSNVLRNDREFTSLRPSWEPIYSYYRASQTCLCNLLDQVTFFHL